MSGETLISSLLQQPNPPATRAESQSQASYPQHNKVDKYNTAPLVHQTDNANYDFKKQQIHNDKWYIMI